MRSITPSSVAPSVSPSASAFPATALPRRTWLQAALAAAATIAVPGLAHAAPPDTSAAKATGATAVEVWKDPSCGCCQDWVDHLQTNGFQVTVHDTGNAAVRSRLGLPQALGSCHTALVGGYLVEGHVPAADVRRLLREKPRALGLAVPGMPVGSPGMDGAIYGGRKDPYDVLLVARDGSTTVFSRQNQDGGKAAAAPGAGASALSDAEVVRWDPATSRVTLRHGELKNLDMPPMTMVFRVPEPTGLALTPGLRVRFLAERDTGGFIARRIEPAQP